MSDGKKFTKTNAKLSPEERLEIAERNFSVILEKIQAYDEVLAEFANINSDLKQSKISVNNVLNKFNEFAQETKSKVENVFIEFVRSKQNYDSINSDLQNQRKILENLINEVRLSNRLFNSKTDELKTNNEQIKEKVEKKLKNENENASSIEIINKTFNENFKILNNLVKDYLEHKDKTEKAILSIGNKIEALSLQMKNLPDLQEWANKVYSKSSQDLAFKEKQITSQTDKKIEQLANDLACDPASADSIKSAIFKEMENLALDGKNAYLKSNNCAQQIQILEKKLENLSLLVKKIELSK